MQKQDYETFRSRLIVELTGIKGNEELLKHIPYIRAADLAIICKLMLDSNPEVYVTAKVTNELISELEIDAERLFSEALNNAQRINPVRIMNISDILGFNSQIEPELTVVTTDQQVKGAAALFYPGVMQQIADMKGGDYYVLPSSVHELLVLADDGRVTEAELREIVAEVNRNEVKPEERLSDFVYHFDAAEHIFENAVDFEKRKKGHRCMQ